jgi:hypothetical protein
VSLDRNAKACITRGREVVERLGEPLDVLGALLWVFHNARSGCCFPSYERIAEKAGCVRSTVAEAVRALEFAGVLTWQNRNVRIRERCTDLFGKDGCRWRVIRTSNAYLSHCLKENVTERSPLPRLKCYPWAACRHASGRQGPSPSAAADASVLDRRSARQPPGHR